MSLIKFEEVLNDLVDYFLIGDPYLLMDFKRKHQLPDDLITEFTTTDEGDRVVEEGVMIPLTGISNYPYTVYFNLNGNSPELLKAENQLQLQQDGYKLQVKYGVIYLYTIPYLRNFIAEPLVTLEKRSTRISLPNGWYKFAVLAGETEQETGMEPTFEFIITAVSDEPDFTADIQYRFTIDASEY
ncbi:hypothetical protein [Pedobacter duraquae]|nr:hypothetical protein [Pedobacter duraquae]